MVMRKIKTDLLNEAGQALVEFALVTLFVILPVTFGIIDGGILFYKWVTLNNGAREGARAGAIYQDSSDPDGTKGTMESIDASRETIIAQAVHATIGPLVTADGLGIDYPDSPCAMGENPAKCGECKTYDVYRGGVCRDGVYYNGGHRVTVTITHTHAPLVGLVIGLDEIDLSAAATMSIEPGGPAPTPTP